MRNQIIVAVALLVSSFSFSQKSELKLAEKAIKSENYADAKTAISAADGLIGAADAKTKAKYYFLKGKAYYANGKGTAEDVKVAISSFEEVEKIEGGSGKYSTYVTEMKQAMLTSFVDNASSAYQAKQYDAAAVKFEQAYRMSKKDTVYLYFAAVSAVTSKDYDSSLEYYKELRELGYKGIETEYKAKNKATGEIESFDNKDVMTFSVQAGTHENPQTTKSKSKSSEIIKNIALIYVNQGKNEEAIAAMQAARKENPGDVNLVLNEANVQLKMGNREEFKKLMMEATQMDPGNATLQYNLGVISADAGDTAAAKKYYERAIQLNPEYADAYNNLAVLILSTEQDIISEMNNLGSSSADNKRYDELKAERLEIYNEAAPYLEKTLKLQPKNIDAARTLMQIYSAVDNMPRFKEMKALVEQLEAGQ
ncbi:MAG: hypothetical protein BM564_09230 [Bacteroidetes bacterium MedPE-SWsnd-G2]|nr:MAG: hypothetical protein BM564_09230 [Bacteroidetes bacterium MedPE-SWsnd-G2]